MPHILAQDYALSSRRGIGDQGVPQNHIRVTPIPFEGAGPAIDFIDITYNATAQFPVGEIPPSSPRRVFAFLTPENFEVHRRIFQTEAPVRIEWRVNSSNPSTPGELAQFAVMTQEEPPGEGPVDTS
jgi:hypothetical protein